MIRGDGVTRRIARARAMTSGKSGKIIITHLHDDHTAGAWGFQSPPTDIYGSGVEALVKGAIAYLTPNAEIRWAEGKMRPMADVFHGHDVAPGLIYQHANVKVTAVENTHFNFPQERPPYGKYKSYSYRFETPDRVVAFSGDTGPSDALMELANGADLLVREVILSDDLVALYKRSGI
jgi:ribonuclease BN (tRNA processing enzyme)